MLLEWKLASASVRYVASAINGYTAYSRESAKEDEKAVRRKIINEMDKTRNNLKNSLEYARENGDKETSKRIRKVLDELDMFTNEVDLSGAGGKYPFFDPKYSIQKEDILKIADLDKFILENCVKVTETCKELQRNILQNKTQDLPYEYGHLRQSITNIRNKYQDRLDYIKHIEPKEESD